MLEGEAVKPHARWRRGGRRGSRIGRSGTWCIRFSRHVVARLEPGPSGMPAHSKCSIISEWMPRIKSGHDNCRRRRKEFDMMRSTVHPPRTVLADCSPPRGAGPNRPTGFQSPSKNIACQYFDYRQAEHAPLRHRRDGNTAAAPRRLRTRLRRRLRDERQRPRRPHLPRRHRDGPSLPVLAYGEVWQRGGFTCKSEQTGMTCFNAERRGFSLSRAKQKVF